MLSSERDNLRYSREGYYCIQGVTNLSFELQMMDENDLQFTFKFTTRVFSSLSARVSVMVTAEECVLTFLNER